MRVIVCFGTQPTDRLTCKLGYLKMICENLFLVFKILVLMLGLFFHRILSPEHNEVPLKSEVVLTRSSFGDTDICSVEYITCSAYDSKSVTNSGVSLF